MKKGSLFIVSAPSGAGKTTLCSEASRMVSKLFYSVSYTTRKPRPGETDGKDYNFVTMRKFREMIKRGEFAEWAEVHGNLYGTSIKSLNDIRKSYDVILDIDTQGAKQMKKIYSEGVYIFILPPSMTVLEERIRKRMANSEEEIKVRLNRAKEEIAEYKEYEYVIINKDLAEAVSELRSIIVAERCRRGRLDQEWIGRLFSSSSVPIDKGD